MFHGRDPYCDPRRLLWRCWLWTTASRGLPDVPIGELHSTPGNCPGQVAADEHGEEEVVSNVKRPRKKRELKPRWRKEHFWKDLSHEHLSIS